MRAALPAENSRHCNLAEKPWSHYWASHLWPCSGVSAPKIASSLKQSDLQSCSPGEAQDWPELLTSTSPSFKVRGAPELLYSSLPLRHVCFLAGQLQSSRLSTAPWLRRAFSHSLSMRKAQLWLASAGQRPGAPAPSLGAEEGWPAATFSHFPGRGELLTWEKKLATDLPPNAFSMREDCLRLGHSNSVLKIRHREYSFIYLQMV